MAAGNRSGARRGKWAGLTLGMGAALSLGFSAGAAQAQPNNDNFRSAFRISSVTSTVVNGGTVDATRESGEPVHAEEGGRSVWFSWVSPVTGSLVLTTAGSNFDTLLGAYRSTTGGATSSFSQLVRLAVNDDNGGQTSRVNVNVVAGQTYYFAIDGFEGEAGAYRLNLTASGSAGSGGRPSNDLFSRAFSIGSVSTGAFTGTNRNATVEAGEPIHDGERGGRSVWFRWVAPRNGRVTFDTRGSNFDTLLAAYRGTSLRGLSVVASNDDTDDNSAGTSSISFNTAGGTTYWIAVDGFEGATGNYRLNLLFNNGSTSGGPSNNFFSNAYSLGDRESGAVTGSSVGATLESGEPRHANTGGRSVWFRWVAPEDGEVTFDTRGSNFDTVLAAYQGSRVSDLDVLDADDDSAGGSASGITFEVEEGDVYYIAVDGFGGASGSYRLNWGFESLDDFNSARPQATKPSVRSS